MTDPSLQQSAYRLFVGTSESTGIPRPPIRSAYSPDRGIPRASVRSAYSPDRGIPRAPVCSAYSPDRGIPRAPVRSAYSPDRGIPRAPVRSAYSPDRGIPRAPDRSAYSPDRGIPRSPIRRSYSPDRDLLPYDRYAAHPYDRVSDDKPLYQTLGYKPEELERFERRRDDYKSYSSIRESPPPPRRSRFTRWSEVESNGSEPPRYRRRYEEEMKDDYRRDMPISLELQQPLGREPPRYRGEGRRVDYEDERYRRDMPISTRSQHSPEFSDKGSYGREPPRYREKYGEGRRRDYEEEKYRGKRKRDRSPDYSCVPPPSDFYCKDCDVVCTSQMDLDIHMGGAKHQKVVKRGGENYCGICKKSYLGDYLKHSRGPTHRSNARTCDNCHQVFGMREDLKEHKCPALVDGPSKVDVKKKKGPPREYYCKDCQITCNSFQMLQRHFQGKSHIQTVDSKRGENGENYCKICNQLFIGAYELHILSRGHKKCAKTCNICCLVFEFDEELKQHITLHTGKDEVKKGEILTAPLIDKMEALLGEQPQMTELVDEVKGYYCRLCLVFFRGELVTKLTHCATEMHLQKCQEINNPELAPQEPEAPQQPITGINDPEPEQDPQQPITDEETAATQLDEEKIEAEEDATTEETATPQDATTEETATPQDATTEDHNKEADDDSTQVMETSMENETIDNPDTTNSPVDE